MRLLSYSSSSFHRNAIAWEKFALRHHLLFFLFPYHFYCVQLVQPPNPHHNHHHHHHHISIVSRTNTSPFDFPPLEGQRFIVWLHHHHHHHHMSISVSSSTTTSSFLLFFTLLCFSLLHFFHSPLKPYYIELSTLHQWSETSGKKFNTKCKHLCITYKTNRLETSIQP